MPRCRPQRNRSTWVLTIAVGLLVPGAAQADPVLYEPGIDPGVGYNVISWWNHGGGGAGLWQDAVQRAYDAGFDEVSLSPVRFFETSSASSDPKGFIPTSSPRGPELSHIASAVTLAKSLGMRVTVNPFAEPKNGNNYFQYPGTSQTWRGIYDPTPATAEWNTFWNSYTQYVVDTAAMAQAAGADAVTVGTELRALELNSGNSAKWDALIDAVDLVFAGDIGYAANWDSYGSTNTTNNIWEHPAVDYIGIDSYFTGMLSAAQANASGDYPNIAFITQVEDAWNNKLDNEILPFAAARKGGAGMPVEFTEIGYLPRNQTILNPQQQGPGFPMALDPDEQNMAFEGLMRALDGRRSDDGFLAAHVWQWAIDGGISDWAQNPLGGSGSVADNLQTAQWLSSFVKGTNPDPGDPPDPPPPTQTQILYSFEGGFDGFHFPGFAGESNSIVALSGNGATDGASSLGIVKVDDDWTWDARVFMAGEQLQAIQEALADDINDYVLELDVTYLAASLPAGLTDMNMHLSFQPTPGDWTQAFPFADINGSVNQSFHVEVPLSAFALSSGVTSLAFHIGFDGFWPNGQNAAVFIDRIALTDLTFVAPENANFDGDDDVDGNDFLAWQIGFGMTDGAELSDGDANGDGAVNELDLAIWETQYGTTGLLVAAAATVPEPATLLSVALALGVCTARRRRASHAA